MVTVNSAYHKVLNFRLSYESSEAVTVKPGINALTPKQFTDLEKVNLFRFFCEAGILDVVKPAKKKKSPKKVKPEKVEF